MEFVVEPGQLEIMAGTSSEDLPLKDVWMNDRNNLFAEWPIGVIREKTGLERTLPETWRKELEFRS